MNIVPNRLAGVLVVEPTVHADARGWFMETYRETALQAAGIAARFVQENHSCSARHTLRGLHYQLHQPQAKLCRVVVGAVWDVVLDLRRASPTFGHWDRILLSAENRRQVYVPRGFAHGFAVVSETAEFLYRCDGYYDRQDEYGVRWNDPDLAIDWGITAPLVSAKDAALPCLRDVPAANLFPAAAPV